MPDPVSRTAISRHSRPLTGSRGAVAAAHPLAVGAGTQMLNRGGNAVDAAVAAQAVVCVAMPHSAGLGGDMLALVREPDGSVIAINGGGASAASSSGSALDSGGAAVTVPGLVDAWSVCHQRWGRLPLSEVLRPAIRLARDGVAVDVDLRVAVDAQERRLRAGGAGDWTLLATATHGVWQQPALADLLFRIGRDGTAAFYRGSAAGAITGAVRRAGGCLERADLVAHRTVVAAPISVDWDGGTVCVQPPASQGVLLAMALRHLDAPGEPDPGSLDFGRLDHLLVELTEAVFQFRSSCGRGTDLLREELAVDPDRAGHRGGPRAYLHTAGVATADRRGMVVSSLVSVFDDFGSAVFVPELGLTLNNRAAGFTDGDNSPGPAKRPVHTLAPTISLRPNGDVLALATPGADGQIQTLLQILGAIRYSGADLATAIAGPRWRSEGGALKIEVDHPAVAELLRRGHQVRPCAPGADLFGAVVASGLAGHRPFAAADWRRHVWSGVA